MPSYFICLTRHCVQIALNGTKFQRGFVSVAYYRADLFLPTFKMNLYRRLVLSEVYSLRQDQKSLHIQCSANDRNDVKTFLILIP